MTPNELRIALAQGLNHIGWIYRGGYLYRRDERGRWRMAPMFVDGSPDLEHEVDMCHGWPGSWESYRRIEWWLEEMEETRLESGGN